MTVVNVQEAKAQLSRLLHLVEAGEDVVISRYGVEVARLVSVQQAAGKRQPGGWRDQITIADDFDDEIDQDWFEPLEPAT